MVYANLKMLPNISCNFSFLRGHCKVHFNKSQLTKLIMKIVYQQWNEKWTFHPIPFTTLNSVMFGFCYSHAIFIFRHCWTCFSNFGSWYVLRIFFSSFLCWPCMLVLLTVPYSVAKYDVQHSFWLISKLSKTNFIILLVIYFVSWSVVIGQSAYGNFSFCIIHIRCA